MKKTRVIILLVIVSIIALTLFELVTCRGDLGKNQENKYISDIELNQLGKEAVTDNTSGVTTSENQGSKYMTDVTLNPENVDQTKHNNDSQGKYMTDVNLAASSNTAQVQQSTNSSLTSRFYCKPVVWWAQLKTLLHI